jgi:hypothetical protein
MDRQVPRRAYSPKIYVAEGLPFQGLILLPGTLSIEMYSSDRTETPHIHGQLKGGCLVKLALFLDEARKMEPVAGWRLEMRAYKLLLY